MNTTRCLDIAPSQALGKRIESDIPTISAEWQRRLEQLKNNISIFLPVEKRRQGLGHMAQLLARCLQRGETLAFRKKTMALARLRAVQGFNLKDSLEEALLLEDILFHWACKTLEPDKNELIQAIGLVHQISHTVVQDIAKVHGQAMDRNLRAREQESFTDGLTHLFNYRFFKEFIQKEIYRSARYQHPVSLVLMDVDFFKKLNDAFGHVGGDQVLVELARLAQGNCRITDLVCRYGGEEFAILLPETPKEQAAAYCERLRAVIEGHPFPLRHSEKTTGITVSVGMANYPDDSQDAQDLMGKADAAMYMAKRGGRNRVCFYAADGALRMA